MNIELTLFTILIIIAYILGNMQLMFTLRIVIKFYCDKYEYN